MAYEVDRVEREMIAHAGVDAATSLAIRRAFLTWYYEATEVCDDSYGGLGDVAGEAVVAYAGTDRRAAGIGAEVFWRDLLLQCTQCRLSACPCLSRSVTCSLWLSHSRGHARFRRYEGLGWSLAHM